MKWDLEALKILAKSDSVPGIALQDAIIEIERLTVKSKADRITIKNMQRRINDLAEKLLKLSQLPAIPKLVCGHDAVHESIHISDGKKICGICGKELD